MFYKWCPNCHNWHFVEGNSSDFYCPRCHYSWDENDSIGTMKRRSTSTTNGSALSLAGRLCLPVSYFKKLLKLSAYLF